MSYKWLKHILPSFHTEDYIGSRGKGREGMQTGRLHSLSWSNICLHHLLPIHSGLVFYCCIRNQTNLSRSWQHKFITSEFPLRWCLGTAYLDPLYTIPRGEIKVSAWAMVLNWEWSPLSSLENPIPCSYKTEALVNWSSPIFPALWPSPQYGRLLFPGQQLCCFRYFWPLLSLAFGSPG